MKMSNTLSKDILTFPLLAETLPTPVIPCVKLL